MFAYYQAPNKGNELFPAQLRGYSAQASYCGSAHDAILKKGRPSYYFLSYH